MTYHFGESLVVVSAVYLGEFNMYQYVDKIHALLETVEKKEQHAIDEAIRLLTTANLEKHSIYIFGASHAGSCRRNVLSRGRDDDDQCDLWTRTDVGSQSHHLY